MWCMHLDPQLYRTPRGPRRHACDADFWDSRCGAFVSAMMGSELMAVYHATPPPAVLDPVAVLRATESSPDLVALDDAVVALQSDGGCLILVEEPISWNRRGVMVCTRTVAALCECGLAAKRYDAGELGSVVVATVAASRTSARPPSPPLLCCRAEHFACERGEAACFHLLEPSEAAPRYAAAAPFECAVCGFLAPPASGWRCPQCRTVLCGACLPAATGALAELSSEQRTELAARGAATEAPAVALTAGLGEWPAVDDAGRVAIWFCWTGENALPGYLELCMETFARRAGGRFRVELVRASDVTQLLLGEVHPAYEHLSRVHRADYLRCELAHRYGGLYCDVDTICWADLSALLHQLESCSAVLYGHALLFEAGMNVGCFRRNSLFTACWRRALHSRLDRRLNSLREFRATNACETEDGLEWNEILRDVLVPLSRAMQVLLPAHVAFTLPAHHWWCPEHEQGFDPLTCAADAAGGPQPPPVPPHTQVVVLNNNQYSPAIKEATRDAFLRSGCALSRLVATALSE